MKRKVGRPRKKNKRIAHSFKMPPDLRDALKTRCKETGEGLSEVIVKGLHRELKEFKKTDSGSGLEGPNFYGNPISDKIRQMLLGADLPADSATQIIESTCRDFGTSPKNLKKQMVTAGFIDNLCNRVEALCAIDESCCAMMKKGLKKFIKG